MTLPSPPDLPPVPNEVTPREGTWPTPICTRLSRSSSLKSRKSVISQHERSASDGHHVVRKSSGRNELAFDAMLASNETKKFRLASSGGVESTDSAKEAVEIQATSSCPLHDPSVDGRDFAATLPAETRARRASAHPTVGSSLLAETKPRRASAHPTVGSSQRAPDPQQKEIAPLEGTWPTPMCSRLSRNSSLKSRKSITSQHGRSASDGHKVVSNAAGRDELEFDAMLASNEMKKLRLVSSGVVESTDSAKEAVEIRATSNRASRETSVDGPALFATLAENTNAWPASTYPTIGSSPQGPDPQLKEILEGTWAAPMGTRSLARSSSLKSRKSIISQHGRSASDGHNLVRKSSGGDELAFDAMLASNETKKLRLASSGAVESTDSAKEAVEMQAPSNRARRNTSIDGLAFTATLAWETEAARDSRPPFAHPTVGSSQQAPDPRQKAQLSESTTPAVAAGPKRPTQGAGQITAALSRTLSRRQTFCLSSIARHISRSRKADADAGDHSGRSRGAPAPKARRRSKSHGAGSRPAAGAFSESQYPPSRLDSGLEGGRTVTKGNVLLFDAPRRFHSIPRNLRKPELVVPERKAHRPAERALPGGAACGSVPALPKMTAGDEVVPFIAPNLPGGGSATSPGSPLSATFFLNEEPPGPATLGPSAAGASRAPLSAVCPPGAKSAPSGGEGGRGPQDGGNQPPAGRAGMQSVRRLSVQNGKSVLTSLGREAERVAESHELLREYAALRSANDGDDARSSYQDVRFLKSENENLRTQLALLSRTLDERARRHELDVERFERLAYLAYLKLANADPGGSLLEEDGGATGGGPASPTFAEPLSSPVKVKG